MKKLIHPYWIFPKQSIKNYTIPIAQSTPLKT